MRKLLSCLILLNFINALHAQEIINTFLGKDQFPNKYIQVNKIVREDIWEYKVNRKGQADSTFAGANNYNYNDSGQIVEEVMINKDDFLNYKNVYAYNDFGSIIKKVEFNYSKQLVYPQTRERTTEFAYDSIGHIAYTARYNEGAGFVNSQKREYDEKGNLYRITKKATNQPEYVANLADYDGNHHITKINYLEYKPEYTLIFKTDSTTNGDKIIHIEKNDELLVTYRFNKYEQFIEKISFDKEGLSKDNYVQKLVYNFDGTPSSFIFYIDGKMEKMFKFYYHK